MATTVEQTDSALAALAVRGWANMTREERREHKNIGNFIEAEIRRRGVGDPATVKRVAEQLLEEEARQAWGAMAHEDRRLWADEETFVKDRIKRTRMA